MKAVICTKYGSPEVLQIKEIDKPIPQDNEVLVKIYATTVTAADYRVRSFSIPASFWIPARLMLGLRKPRKSILGMELSGKIESVGKNVKLFKEGDQVFACTLQTFGAYAEYKCIAEDGPMTLKPTEITHGEAAALPVGARTALHYLKHFGNIKPKQKVLIYGASGSVGTYAVQLAKYYGAEVTGVCSTANVDLVLSLGADKVIDYSTGNPADQFDNYDIIFVTVDKYPFSTFMTALNANGVYLNIGKPMKSLRMIWASITGNRKIVVGNTSPVTVEDLMTLKEIIKEGHLKPVIDRTFSLNQIVEAHRYVDKGHKKGNVIITVHEDESN